MFNFGFFYSLLDKSALETKMVARKKMSLSHNFGFFYSLLDKSALETKMVARKKMSLSQLTIYPRQPKYSGVQPTIYLTTGFCQTLNFNS